MSKDEAVKASEPKIQVGIISAEPTMEGIWMEVALLIQPGSFHTTEEARRWIRDKGVEGISYVTVIVTGHASVKIQEQRSLFIPPDIEPMGASVELADAQIDPEQNPEGHRDSVRAKEAESDNVLGDEEMAREETPHG